VSVAGSSGRDNKFIALQRPKKVGGRQTGNGGGKPMGAHVNYTEEFKREILRLHFEDRICVARLSEQYKIAKATIYCWRKEYTQNDNAPEVKPAKRAGKTLTPDRLQIVNKFLRDAREAGQTYAQRQLYERLRKEDQFP
jgi:transposase-like protein